MGQPKPLGSNMILHDARTWNPKKQQKPSDVKIVLNVVLLYNCVVVQYASHLIQHYCQCSSRFGSPGLCCSVPKTGKQDLTQYEL